MCNSYPKIAERCPNCGANSLSIFYQVRGVPVHSVLLHQSVEEAVGYVRGDIQLGYCANCGFITNTLFDPTVHEYSTKYEATQGYSSTFNAFHLRLAETLISRNDLHGKTIIEIGCGQGEFLDLLCKSGQNEGIGFDPAYVPERSPIKPSARITFIQDFFSEKHTGYQADFICCKMTLEHIHQTARFLYIVHRSVEDRKDSIVFFQVPNGEYVFGQAAFWDIYYEHCSYFTKNSLARLFQKTGFEVTDLWADYNDQYLMVEARPIEKAQVVSFANGDSLEQIIPLIDQFKSSYAQREASWRRWIAEKKAGDQKVVLWGGGSKGVAFLTTLGISRDEIEFVIDINPFKHRTFMAGTGQEIVNPDFLSGYRPDTVIVMNPIYEGEVRNQLRALGLNPELISVASV